MRSESSFCEFGGRRIFHFDLGSKISHVFTFLSELVFNLKVREMFSSFSLFVFVFVLLWFEEIMVLC